MNAGDWAVIAAVIGALLFVLFVGWRIVRAGDDD
jgi:hypothetical protein